MLSNEAEQALISELRSKLMEQIDEKYSGNSRGSYPGKDDGFQLDNGIHVHWTNCAYRIYSNDAFRRTVPQQVLNWNHTDDIFYFDFHHWKIVKRVWYNIRIRKYIFEY